VHLKLIAQQNGAEKGLEQPFDPLLPCWLGLVLIGVVAVVGVVAIVGGNLTLSYFFKK